MSFLTFYFEQIEKYKDFQKSQQEKQHFLTPCSKSLKKATNNVQTRFSVFLKNSDLCFELHNITRSTLNWLGGKGAKFKQVSSLTVYILCMCTYAHTPGGGMCSFLRKKGVCAVFCMCSFEKRSEERSGVKDCRSGL